MRQFSLLKQVSDGHSVNSFFPALLILAYRYTDIKKGNRDKSSRNRFFDQNVLQYQIPKKFISFIK